MCDVLIALIFCVGRHAAVFARHNMRAKRPHLLQFRLRLQKDFPPIHSRLAAASATPNRQRTSNRKNGSPSTLSHPATSSEGWARQQYNKPSPWPALDLVCTRVPSISI